MAKNRVKFDIALPMDEEIDTKEQAILKGSGIKMPLFTYKGEVETERSDITQKKVEDKFKRSARMLYATAAMHITDAIKSNKLDGKTKDKAAITTATKSIDSGCEKVARKMTKLMDEILKGYGGGNTEAPSFDNLGQIERYVASLAEIETLGSASKALKDGIIAVCKGPKERAIDELAKAYAQYTRTGAKGLTLTDGHHKIPKVDATGSDGKAIEKSKVDSETDKETAKQVDAMKETAEMLQDLVKPMANLHARTEAIRTAYEALQTQARKSGVTVSDGARFPMLGTHDIDPVMKAQAQITTIIKTLKRSLK